MAKQLSKRSQKNKTAIKDYLKGRGHKAVDVDIEIDGKRVVLALLQLHGVTDEQYRVAGGKDA